MYIVHNHKAPNNLDPTRTGNISTSLWLWTVEQ